MVMPPSSAFRSIASGNTKNPAKAKPFGGNDARGVISAGYFGSIQVGGVDPLVVLQIACCSLDGDLPHFQESLEQLWGQALVLLLGIFHNGARLSQGAMIFPVNRAGRIALEAAWVVEENGEQACLNCG
jgi:hypothetical protein